VDTNKEEKQPEKTIHNLELHEILPINGFSCVMKAPKGWFYIFSSNEGWDDNLKTFRATNIRAVHYIPE
jgi:hypothetical protein